MVVMMAGRARQGERAAATREGMNRCLPDLPAEVYEERAAMTRHLVTQMAAERERALADDAPACSRATWCDVATGLIDVIVALWQAPVTQTTPERIDPDTRLDQLGLESLMAAELSSVLQRRLDCVVPTMELATAAGVRQLAPRLLGRVRRGA